MSALIPWPFPLPDRFLDELGYGRAVEACDSPAVRARIAELLRRRGIEVPPAAPIGPRRYVLLYGEPTGAALVWSDGARSGAGRLDHRPFLDHLHGGQSFGPIDGRRVEHRVDPGSSQEPATHALVLDRQTGRAWVAPIARARRIVRAQDLEAEP
jgi:hypothetical protein